MKDIMCNLEEISILLDSAVDNMIILYDEMTPGRINAGKAHSAMYGVCAQLGEIAAALRACYDALEFSENQP